jgi:hypothetical protein
MKATIGYVDWTKIMIKLSNCDLRITSDQGEET